jgi:hypothetical protein
MNPGLRHRVAELRRPAVATVLLCGSGLMVQHDDPAVARRSGFRSAQPAALGQVRLDPEAHTFVSLNGADFDRATLHEWTLFADELSKRARAWATQPRRFASRQHLSGSGAFRPIPQRRAQNAARVTQTPHSSSVEIRTQGSRAEAPRQAGRMFHSCWSGSCPGGATEQAAPWIPTGSAGALRPVWGDFRKWPVHAA